MVDALVDFESVESGDGEHVECEEEKVDLLGYLEEDECFCFELFLLEERPGDEEHEEVCAGSCE